MLVLVETFSSDAGWSVARRVADAGAYEVAAEATLAPVRLLEPRPLTPTMARRWGPGITGSEAMALLVPTTTRRRGRARQGRVRARGSWEVALLSRLPILDAKVVELTPLPRDKVRRVLLVAQIEVGGTALRVVGTHFPHLSDGSLFRLAELRQQLPAPSNPGVLLGDMNCFGPPLELALPGWRRAVRGRSWPAWRPVCQPDHILIDEAVQCAGGDVVAFEGSDHRPVRATLQL